MIEKPTIRIGTGGATADLNVVAAADAGLVSSVIEKFRGKYGDSGLKFYSKLDVAVLADMQ